MGFSSSVTVVAECRKDVKRIGLAACSYNGDAATAAAPPPRLLKREDHSLPPSHDKLFSDWKELVGPTDWCDHNIGLEGAEKYRFDNVRSSWDGPGVYELALHLDRCNGGHRTRKDASRCLNRGTITVVYVGQAEKVRTRLQEYGRCGSHLEGAVSPSSYEEGNGSCFPQLFTKCFSHGCSIAFRWAKAESKADAAAIEAGLLKIYDYAWNKGNNGERRPYDIFMKVQQQTACNAADCMKASNKVKASRWIMKFFGNGNVLQAALQDRLWKPGKRVSTVLPVFDRDDHLYGLLCDLPWKLLERDALPILASLQSCHGKHKGCATNICGIKDGKGVVCTTTPAKGRKRCEGHKGMRLHTSITKTHPFRGCGSEEIDIRGVELSLSLQCGYILEDGSGCSIPPVKGRKRCAAHKGRRVRVQK